MTTPILPTSVTPGTSDPLSVEPSFEEGPSGLEPSDSDVFDHVVENILKITRPDHPIKLAIKANFMYMTVTDFQLFTDEQFRDMSYPSSTTSRVLPLLPGASQLLIKFKQFMRLLQKNHGGLLPNSRWLQLTHEDFVRYVQTPELVDPDATFSSSGNVTTSS